MAVILAVLLLLVAWPAHAQNFPMGAATQTTIQNVLVSQAIAVRCVTAAGTAFESCAGAGGGSGGDGAINDGVNAAIKATVTGANALKVDGSAVTQPVSGTFWQATQPVSGPLTDAQLRATAVPVSGTFWQATQPVSGTVTANAGTGTMAVSGPLTDAQLRATAVPVSGPLTDTQLRASAVTVTANAGTGTFQVRCANMASTAYEPCGAPISTQWQCSLDAIAATLTQCQAAPGAGVILYISGYMAGSTTATAGQHLLRYGTGTNCGTGTTTLFPGTGTTARVPSPANTVAPTMVTFDMPIKVPANNALCVIGVATNTTWIVITGFTHTS